MMELHSEALLREQAGPVGTQLADNLAGKTCEVVDGFPASDTTQRVAITRLVAHQLLQTANDQEAKAND